MAEYKPQTVEEKWQGVWQREKTFRAVDDDPRPKYYVLEMFAYPSGKLHMGHVRNYTLGDVVARQKRMRGFSVLHPVGWDAFGLPAENAAIKNQRHPREWTYSNIAHMRGQLKRLGISYDWDRELATCHPAYYRWQQLMFVRLAERGLAYRKASRVNWCPSCATVLANEQVVNGACWRCGQAPTLRDMEQWFLRITDYAQELLEALDGLAGRWPDMVLAMQRNWIGRSEGTEIEFPLEEEDARALGVKGMPVYTTRPDTLFGVTFMAVDPAHEIARKLAARHGRAAQLESFVQSCSVAEVLKKDDEREKVGHVHRRLLPQSLHRRARAYHRRQLRGRRIWLRRGHGRAGARPARFRVRQDRAARRRASNRHQGGDSSRRRGNCAPKT